jgi:hypothetical protein
MFDLGPAAQQLSRLVTGLRDDQLDHHTPCADWTVMRPGRQTVLPPDTGSTASQESPLREGVTRISEDPRRSARLSSRGVTPSDLSVFNYCSFDRQARLRHRLIPGRGHDRLGSPAG